MIYEKISNMKDSTFQIKEMTGLTFNYPYFAMIKGCNEVFIYDYTKEGEFSYLRLNSPIICTSSTFTVLEEESLVSAKQKGKLKIRSLPTAIKCMIDMGDFLVYSAIDVEDTENVNITFSKRFIEKRFLKNEKIICVYDPIPYFWGKSEDCHLGLTIHSVNFLQGFNLWKYNTKKVLNGKWKKGDIKHKDGQGLLFGKRGGKLVTYIPVPIALDEKLQHQALYTSNTLINGFDYHEDENGESFVYLSDEDQYIKKYKLMVSDGQGTLSPEKEWYVNQTYRCDEPFKMTTTMLFEKNKGFTLQERGKETPEQEETYSPNLQIKQSTMSSEFPMMSQGIMLFIGEEPNNKSLMFSQNEAIILPSYAAPLYNLLPTYLLKYLNNEFFYYPPGIDSEYIVYQLNRTDQNVIQFAFYKRNGKYVTSEYLNIEGVDDYSKVNLVVSPNGKYVFYLEDKPDSSLGSGTSGIFKTVGKIKRFVCLRPKEAHNTIKSFKKDSRKVGATEYERMIRSKVNVDDVIFKLKDVKSVPEIGERMANIKNSEADAVLSEEISVFITNNGDMIFVDKHDGCIFFNDIDLTAKID